LYNLHTLYVLPIHKGCNLYSQQRDVEGFAESILERSVLLMEQIEFVESKSKSVNESAACTKEHIKKLREILWPQRFIKDIAYANIRSW
jgi:sensor c-di-GMP phosphodiesterase-like protein